MGIEMPLGRSSTVIILASPNQYHFMSLHMQILEEGWEDEDAVLASTTYEDWCVNVFLPI